MTPVPLDWIRRSGGRILVAVKVIPNASKSGLAGMRDGCLLARVAAPPEKGKANDELRSLLSRTLGLPRSDVELVSGGSSRRKCLSLPADSESALRALAGLDQQASPPAGA